MKNKSKLPFQLRASSPIARFESGVAVVRNKMFVIGGHLEPDLIATKSTLAYDPKNDLWTSCQDAPVAISHVTAAVVDDRYIWLVGGFVGQHPGYGIALSYRYDVDDDCWESGPPLPQVRASGCLALVGRYLHYCGGVGGNRHTNFDDHWILNVDNPTQWEPQAPIPFGRTHAATSVIEDYIYAIGGHFGHDIPGHPGIISPNPDLDYVHRFDPKADRWEEVAPLPRRRSHCEPGTFVYEGKIICIGGRNNSPNARSRYEKNLLAYYFRRAIGKMKRILESDSSAYQPWLDDVIAYDPKRDLWLDIGRLPQTLYAPAASIVERDIIVTNGGEQGWQNPSDKTFRLDMIGTLDKI